MKKTCKRVCIQTIVCLLMVLAMLAAPLQAQAEQKPYMEKINVSWDLKPEKKVIFQSKYRKMGYRDMTVMLKNYKIKNASKDGYKKLTFTVVFDWDPRFTDEEFEEYAHACRAVTEGDGIDFETKAGHKFDFDIVRYSTGTEYEEKNKEGVIIKQTDWKGSKPKRYEDSCGCWWQLNTVFKSKYTVTYPENYQDLCLTAFGSSGLKSMSYDETVPLGETVFYSDKNKKVVQAMRVK